MAPLWLVNCSIEKKTAMSEPNETGLTSLSLTNSDIKEEVTQDDISLLQHAALRASLSTSSPQRASDDIHEAKNYWEARTEQLANSLSLLTAALESTADGIIVLDFTGKVVAYNTKFTAIWQYSTEILERRNSREMSAHSATLVKEPEAFLQLLKEHLANPERETFHLIELKDGRTFERYGFPQRVNEKVVGVVINLREVTERKKVDAALRLSEEKYRLLWATAGDAFLLFNRDNIILEANPSLATILGYEPEEVIGQNIAILQPEHLREGHRRGLQRYLESGVRKLDWRATEVPGLHRDGREVPLEIAFNHLHVDGQDLFSGFIRDISERKASERSLARLAAIVDSSDDAIVSKTTEGIITSWNRGAERIFGYSSSEAIGQPILMIIPPDRAEEEPQILERMARGERVEHFETIRIRKDGQLIHVSITLSPIRDNQGNIIGISKIARDITQRKQAEAEREELLASEQNARQEAEAANRAKDEFLATLSHELRTPLNAILGWSQLVSDSRLDEEARTEGLGIIQRNARLQAHLVEDLLDVSRIITGNLRLEVQAVDLASVIESAVESVLPSAEAKEIRLQRVLDSGNTLVLGDPARLQQVVWNLLTNAIKFTPKKGRVQIRLERINSHIEVVVTDTGIGIAPEVLPYIFERFRQADQSSTRNYGGLGLGLAIVRHIAEAHGGSVEAESPGEEQGTTFTIKLPLMATRSVDLASQDREERVHPTAHSSSNMGYVLECPEELEGVHVLVVDDDEDARRLVSNILQGCRAKVTTASTAAEGLSTLQSARPDILISDLGMPDEDGYSLIRQVRALPPEQGGQTPAAALTAYARVEDRLKVLRSGFQIHLPKPIEPAELVAVVANLAQRINT